MCDYGEPPTTITFRCAQCGTSERAHPDLDDLCLLCDLKRRKEAMRLSVEKRRARRVAQRVPRMIQCAECEAEVAVRSNRQQYCDTCAVLVRRRRQAHHYHQARRAGRIEHLRAHYLNRALSRYGYDETP
jgi:hypothetical protein